MVATWTSEETRIRFLLPVSAALPASRARRSLLLLGKIVQTRAAAASSAKVQEIEKDR
jgi:hypothetical protein